MNPERREAPRLARRIECRWKGATGGGASRITDLSIGGCFVETLSAPAVGEVTAVTVDLDADGPVSLSGVVVAVDDGIGFAVRFSPFDPGVEARLARFLATATVDAGVSGSV